MRNSDFSFTIILHPRLPASPEHRTCSYSRGEVTSTLRLLESHGDCVLRLPPNSQLLASSSSCSHEICTCCDDNILAIQGHPEITVCEFQEKVLPSLKEKRK
jgi:GMP synthase-like glutamine amidotransferase